MKTVSELGNEIQRKALELAAGMDYSNVSTPVLLAKHWGTYEELDFLKREIFEWFDNAVNDPFIQQDPKLLEKLVQLVSWQEKIVSVPSCRNIAISSEGTLAVPVPAKKGFIVKRERARQIVVGLVGLLYVALIYPLYTDLLHSSWLLVQKNETEPMFLSFYIALGVFLLLAARKPSDYRSLILFAAWQSIAHASVMVIQTVEAWKNGIHRDFKDVVIAGVIGLVLLTLVPAKRQSAATVGA